ncbi:hypothetical protein L218DRAFT_102578 [Marasmius fiardii PR-910]|nr:hypothetical protein L218DRAFT_102578 [Marasmius fiardii PR-910]
MWATWNHKSPSLNMSIRTDWEPTPPSPPYRDAADCKHKRVFSLPLQDLRKSIRTINPLESAASFRYRFIDACAFLDHDRLDIHEFKNLPLYARGEDPFVNQKYPSPPQSGKYCAISYPWKGIDAHPSHDWIRKYTRHCFSVEGAENGDPISIRVLQDVAEQARKLRLRWIWMDTAGGACNGTVSCVCPFLQLP